MSLAGALVIMIRWGGAARRSLANKLLSPSSSSIEAAGTATGACAVLLEVAIILPGEANAGMALAEDSRPIR